MIHKQVAFGFVSGSEEVVFDGPHFGGQDDILDLFEGGQSVLLSQLDEIFEDHGLQLDGFHDGLVSGFAGIQFFAFFLPAGRRRSAAVFLPPILDDGLFRDDDGDEAGFERFPVDEDLRHVRRLRVHVLDLLRRDVLALRQLEDVLLPVDHFERSVRVESADVAGVKPTWRVSKGKSERGRKKERKTEK